MKTRIVTAAAAAAALTLFTAALSANAQAYGQPYQEPYQGPREQTRDQARFCGSLASFHADTAAFNALGPDAPESAVRDAAKRIRNDADNVREAGSSMQGSAARDFDHAAERLKRDYESVHDNVSAQQSHQVLQNDVQNLRVAAHQLAIESNCPPMTRP